MSIKTVYNTLCGSEVYILRLGTQVAGFRVKIYNIDTNDFTYYDFALSDIVDHNLKVFLNSHKSSFNSLSLIEHSTSGMNKAGELVTRVELNTQEELNGDYVVQEVKSKTHINTILNRMVQLYTIKEGY